MIQIVLTALKGGTGVSTLASGLCQAAAAEDLDVLCVDHDDQDLLKYSFGMVGLSDGGEMRNGNPRIRLVPSSATISGADPADVMVVDLPKAQMDRAGAVVDTSDAILLVVPASATGVAQAPSIKRFLAQADNRFILLNQQDPRIPLKKTAAAYLQAEFSDRIIGQVRQDGAIEEALASLEPLSRAAPYSAAWADMRAAFASLLSHMNDLPVLVNGAR